MRAIDGSPMISKRDLCSRLQGLSGVEIERLCSSWPLGGSKTRMEASASKDTPSRNNEVIAFLSTSTGPVIISFGFFPRFRPKRPPLLLFKLCIWFEWIMQL